jgi:hypothetical protein
MNGLVAPRAMNTRSPIRGSPRTKARFPFVVVHKTLLIVLPCTSSSNLAGVDHGDAFSRLEMRLLSHSWFHSILVREPSEFGYLRVGFAKI